MNNPFDYTPDIACDEAFRRLIAKLEKIQYNATPEEIGILDELRAGKMLGVLIACDSEGVSHTLYAFSGQLGDKGFRYGDFVEPIFDYLSYDCYFTSESAKISQMNREIDEYESQELKNARIQFEIARHQIELEISAFREKCMIAKQRRKLRRESGEINETEMADLIRQSQFEKAELHRLKKKCSDRLVSFESKLREAIDQLDVMKQRRRKASEDLQKRLFDDFTVLNACGESKTLSEIFSETSMKVPPSGAGECCAPKLLQAAYRRGWLPISMAEYWYGRSTEGDVRVAGHHYPACRGKCRPILAWMLQGLEIIPSLRDEYRFEVLGSPNIIYENEWFCVVDKPSGMLSVPGKSDEISLQQWLIEKYGNEKEVKMAHRLDQATSGLIIATFGPHSYKIMQSLFARQRVAKTYIADLDGDYHTRPHAVAGIIDLHLSPDWLDRPRQRVDFESGKPAITEYEFIDAVKGRSRIKFYPKTGRTHQLRVHAASESGLGMPITGDHLYGSNCIGEVDRLHLHAHRIEFTFPIDGKNYCFESPVPF